MKQVEAWVEAQTDDNFINRIRRAAVIWEVPPGTVTKLQKQPLGRLIRGWIVHGTVTACCRAQARPML